MYKNVHLDVQTSLHKDIYKSENLWYNRNSTNEKYGGVNT